MVGFYVKERSNCYSIEVMPYHGYKILTTDLCLDIPVIATFINKSSVEHKAQQQHFFFPKLTNGLLK